MFKLKEIVTFILLTAFLVTSLGSMLGCVCCDCGSLSDTHIANHVDDHADKKTDGHIEDTFDIHAVVYIDGGPVTLDQHYRDTGDLCVDSPIEFSSGIVEKIEGIKSFTDIDLFSSHAERVSVEPSSCYVNKCTSEPRPRISQTILSQRTVVLLS